MAGGLAQRFDRKAGRSGIYSRWYGDPASIDKAR
jgi:hypothetical protein